MNEHHPSKKIPARFQVVTFATLRSEPEAKGNAMCLRIRESCTKWAPWRWIDRDGRLNQASRWILQSAAYWICSRGCPPPEEDFSKHIPQKLFERWLNWNRESLNLRRRRHQMVRATWVQDGKGLHGSRRSGFVGFQDYSLCLLPESRTKLDTWFTPASHQGNLEKKRISSTKENCLQNIRELRTGIILWVLSLKTHQTILT